MGGRDSWIIDGFGPWPVIDRRMERADTIVYIDLPFRTHLWWAAKRQVASRLAGRAWAGQTAAPPTLRLFRTLRRLNALRPQIFEVVSRNDRSAKLVHLRSPAALDGEIVIEREGRLDFDAMQMRLHPAESRVRKLSAETPSRYVAFDILLWNGEPLHARPLAERRAELEKRAKGFSLSPISKDAAVARQWLERLEILGADGAIAKRPELPHNPGSPEAACEGKHHPTAGCGI